MQPTELFIEKAIPGAIFEGRGNYNFAWGGDIFLGGRGATFSFFCWVGQISIGCPGDRALRKTRRGEATFKTGTGELQPWCFRGWGHSASTYTF